MTYLEEYFIEYHTDMQGFLESQEDYDGFCPRDIGIIDSCTGMECMDCWNREIYTNYMFDNEIEKLQGLDIKVGEILNLYDC